MVDDGGISTVYDGLVFQDRAHLEGDVTRGESVMRIAEKVMALLGAIRLEDIEALPPARRRQFADLCRHWAGVAESAKSVPLRSGVLADLKSGDRIE